MCVYPAYAVMIGDETCTTQLENDMILKVFANECACV